MPINPKLKAQFEADTTMTPEYREKLLATLEDAPASVQSGWLAQADYSRQTQKYKAEMEDFYSKSTIAVNQHQEVAKRAEEARVAAEARLAELEAGGVPKIPGQEFADAKEIAGLKTLIQGLDTKLTEFSTKADLNTAYQSAVGFIGEQMLTLNELAAQHAEKFGKRFTINDQKELVTFANTRAKELNRTVSLDEAYAMKHGDDIKKKETERLEAEITERIMTAHKIPGGVDGPVGGAPIDKGPAQIRMEQEANRRAGKTDAAAAGYQTWQEAAAAGANELVSEGKV